MKPPSLLATRMSRLSTESAFQTSARVRELVDSGRDIVNLGIGSPDFLTADHIVDAGRKALQDGYHFYTDPKGLPELRDAVATTIRTRLGCNVDIENILIVPGGKPTMHYAVMMFGEPGHEILYPDPGFPIYESLIRFTGATPVPFALDSKHDFALDPDEIISRLNARTSLIILNSPSNPTGSVHSRNALATLARHLERFPDTYVLSDEIYSQIYYDEEPPASMLEFESVRDRVILLDGRSKAYSMTGWRLGFGVWPRTLINHAEKLQVNSCSCVSASVQMVGLAALVGPQDNVQTMRKAFLARRNLMHELLNAVPGISCGLPRGAFYTFANIRGLNVGSKEFANELLTHAGVATLAGDGFGPGGEGYLRISFAKSQEQITEGIARIHDYVVKRDVLSTEPGFLNGQCIVSTTELAAR